MKSINKDDKNEGKTRREKASILRIVVSSVVGFGGGVATIILGALGGPVTAFIGGVIGSVLVLGGIIAVANERRADVQEFEEIKVEERVYDNNHALDHDLISEREYSKKVPVYDEYKHIEREDPYIIKQYTYDRHDKYDKNK